MRQSMVLLSTHGTIVCKNGVGSFYHVPIASLNGEHAPLEVDLDMHVRSGRFKRMLAFENAAIVLSGLPGLPDGCDLIVSENRRTVTLRQNGMFFSAEPANQMLINDRVEARSWESCVPITQRDFSNRRNIMLNDWIIGSTKQIIQSSAILLQENFRLVVGPVVLDLRYQLPLLEHSAASRPAMAEAFSFTILIDGWKIEQLFRYKPFIYTTAFGSPDILDRAISAVQSLVEFGKFDGQIHIITDREKQFFVDALPEVDFKRVSLQHLAPKDNVGFLAAKLAILDYVPAFDYQPLFYIDSDVICDAPLEGMLATVVTLDRMSAPLEETTSLLTNPSVGSTLIHRAGLSPRFACGINTGTIGIPNLHVCSEDLELIRTVLTNYVEYLGREELVWGDQEVINYVSYQAAHFDASSLLRFVRYAWAGDEFDGDRRLGLLHFWPPVEGRYKQDRMRSYMTTLRGRLS